MVLKGRVAIVTGGAKGIGAAFAAGLAEAGASVMVVDIDEPGAKAAAEKIRSTGAEVSHLYVDVSEKSSVDAMASETEKRFGGIEVNNAAMYSNLQRKPFYEQDPSEFDAF